MADDGQISALERLAKLRDSGGLTEQEYEKEKAKLLSGSDAPFYRRLWFVVLLTVLILTFPIALLILLTGPVYRKTDGTRAPIQNRTRYIYAGALGVWLAAAIINMAAGPSISAHWKRSADPTVASSDKTTGADDASQKVAASDQQEVPEACDSSDAADEVKDAIENGPVSKLVQVKMEDFGHPKELMFDRKANARYCEADAVLNTGETAISYRFFFGPSGSQMIEVKEGKDAFGTEAMKIRASILSQYSPTIQARANGEIPLDAPVPADTSAPTPLEQDFAQNSATSTPSGSTAQSNGPVDPLETRYSPAYERCLNSGNAANGNTSAMRQCTDNELAVQNGKLNSTYKAVMAALGPAQQTKLRDTERAWIKYRDQKCMAENQTGGTIDQLGIPSCHLEMTIRRTMELEQMQADRNSVGPMASNDPKYVTYTNDRFGFSIQYPPELLTMQRAPDNDDGRTFKSADGKATILAFGRYLTDGEKSEAIVRDAEANCPNHHASYRIAKPNLVAVSCQISGTIKYQKTIISGDTAITLDASYPASKSPIWIRWWGISLLL